MAFTIKKRSKQEAGENSEKPARKTKAFKASKGSKFVLFVGDEGAILIYIKGNVVERRQFVPDTTPGSLDEITSTFHEDTTAPVTLVVDTMDQSYVQQTLPPVSSLSVNKLIKRRLDRDFGTSDIKGALLLGREKSGRKDWNFLMIAVEKTRQLTTWLDYIAELPNRFAGINLAAVETENLLKALEHTVQSDQPPSEWKFLVAHNKVGGFRQVILRNNRIVFTRLAQPVGESSPEVVAGNIEQEILNTIEYMKRMSFTVQAGLDIYIIGSSNLKTAINKSRFNANAFHILTPYEVAESLNIEGATQPNDQFADVILAAVIGCSKKHVLTLTVPQFSRVQMFVNIQRAQRVGAVLAALALLGYTGSGGIDLYNAIVKKEELKAQKAENQKKLSVLHEKIISAHVNIDTISELIDMYWQLLAEKVSPVPLIYQLIPLSTHPNARIKAIEWNLDQSAPPPPPGAAANKNAVSDTLVAAPPLPNGANMSVPVNNDRMNVVITMQFYTNPGEQKTMTAIAKELLEKYKETFKGYDVKYNSLPAAMQETENVNIDLEASAPAAPAPAPANNTDIKLTISGFVDPSKAATPALTTPLPGRPAS